MISTTRHRFSLLKGRVSMIRTTSPVRHEFCSSWALNFLVRRMVRLYLGCMTVRSTATTTVLSILSETTVPTRVLRTPRWDSVTDDPSLLPRPLAADVQLPLPFDVVNAGDVLADGPHPHGIVQLSRGQLEAEVEQLLLQLGQLALQLLVAQLPDFLRLHVASPPATRPRSTIFVFTGSLWATSRSAYRATSSASPPTSNMIRPGLTTATQYSGEPLPPPMRTSAGFLVTGLWGKMVIHTFPPRRM